MRTGEMTTTDPFSGLAFTQLPAIMANLAIYVATTGNDTTGIGTAALPFATIQKAMSYLQNFHSPSGTGLTFAAEL